MRLYSNNKLAINITHNLVQHKQTKDIKIDEHLIKEKLDIELPCMLYVPIGS